MKIMAFSDSHGSKRAVINILRAIEEQRPDALIHLGDGAGDARAIESGADMPVYAVCGNCDAFTALPKLLAPEFCGVKFMLCHGHGYQVKSGFEALEKAAKKLECTVALFGHTHVPLIQQRQDLLLINPGAACGFPGSYALVTVGNSQIISAELFPLCRA